MVNDKPSKKIFENQAYKKIKLLIIENKLKPGEKIIQQRTADELGISIGMVISTLSILQKERLVEHFPRRGFFVKNISKKEYTDLLEVRSILESLAVENISKNLNDPVKKQLLGFLNKFETAYRNNDTIRYSELDKEFHCYIIEASGNSYLIDINNSFNILLLCYTKGFKTKIDVSVEHHRKIINAILNRESEKAASLMITHLEKIKDYF